MIAPDGCPGKGFLQGKCPPNSGVKARPGGVKARGGTAGATITPAGITASLNES
jgi:hypothetical protein